MTLPRQGELWWAVALDKRRPVMVITRSEAVEVLTGIVVAPVTRTVRGIETEIPLDHREGLPVICAASFDNLQRVDRRALSARIGSLGPRRAEICRALAALADC